MNMRISHLDHFVLTVTSIADTIAFYTKVLNMETVYFGEGRVALTFGSQKINLHELGHEFEPKAQQVQAGSADLCFIITTPLAEAMQHVERQGVDVLEGSVKRTGAQGAITSFYCRDPDGNLIEISSYTDNTSTS